nr:VanW family protein [bacterium]
MAKDKKRRHRQKTVEDGLFELPEELRFLETGEADPLAPPPVDDRVGALGQASASQQELASLQQALREDIRPSPQTLPMGGLAGQRAGNNARKQASPRKNSQKSKKRRSWMGIGMVAAALVALIVLGLTRPLRQETVYVGVHVDGVHLGGMTQEEVRAALARMADAQMQQMKVSLVLDDKSWNFVAGDLGATSNAEQLAEEVWAVGRTGSAWQRLGAIRALKRQEVDLHLEIHTDVSLMRQAITQIAREVDTPAQDATIIFTPGNADPFRFVEARDGRMLDTEKVYQAVEEAFEKDINITVDMAYKVISPEIEVGDLKPATQLRATAGVSLAGVTGDRLYNIKRAAAYINGKRLAPGETGSFNAWVGKRGVYSNYLSIAALDDDPAFVDGPGGGVARVASALYQAALLADLPVTARGVPALQSDYALPGFGVRVSDTEDLAFENNTPYPLFIAMEVKGEELVCTLYGQPLAEGRQLSLSGTVLSTGEAPAGTDVRQDAHNTYVEYEDEVKLFPAIPQTRVRAALVETLADGSTKETVISEETYAGRAQIELHGTKKRSE